MLQQQKVFFAGAGPMAESIIAGLINNGMDKSLIYITNYSNTSRLKQLKEKYGVQIYEEETHRIADMNIIVLAMQPKGLDEYLWKIKQEIHASQLLLSVVTSITTEYIEQQLHQSVPVIRVMPNTPSMIGEGVTGYSAGKYVKNNHRMMAETLLRSIGKVFDVPKEQMNIFTGLSGCSPAFFYSIVKAMVEEGVASGLPNSDVLEMVAQTMLGSAKMILNQEESLDKLIQNVAAHDGPTDRGVQAFIKHNGVESLKEAVKTSAARSKEIELQFTKGKQNQQ